MERKQQRRAAVPGYLQGAFGRASYRNGTDPADEAAWQLAGVSTKAVFKVTGLKPANMTWFRVNAIGTSGTGPLSEVAHSLAK